RVQPAGASGTERRRTAGAELRRQLAGDQRRFGEHQRERDPVPTAVRDGAAGAGTVTSPASSRGSWERRLAITAQTMSCIWWKSISGSTASEAWAPNRTLAMGSPEARDFLEPANWMAMRSPRSKRSALAP